MSEIRRAGPLMVGKVNDDGSVSLTKDDLTRALNAVTLAMVDAGATEMRVDAMTLYTLCWLARDGYHETTARVAERLRFEGGPRADSNGDG